MSRYNHCIFYMVGAIVFFSTSCNENDRISVYNPELVFPEAFEIIVPEYTFTETISGKTFIVKGDTIADTLNNSPIFRWEDISTGIYSVAISNAPIRVKNGTMVNPESIIWQWHNTMGADYISGEGAELIEIAFTNGREVFNKKILYNTQPLPLENGLYFWMVWGWDKTGKRVLYSSRQKSFFVE